MINAKFYVRHQKKLVQVHQQDVDDDAQKYVLRGFVQIQPLGGLSQVITQDLMFERMKAEYLDFAFFLFDADAVIKKLTQ